MKNAIVKVALAFCPVNTLAAGEFFPVRYNLGSNSVGLPTLLPPFAVCPLTLASAVLSTLADDNVYFHESKSLTFMEKNLFSTEQ